MRKISVHLVILFTAMALVAGLWLGHGYAASSVAAPGSDQDPLVTKSYVDDAISKLAAELENSGQPSDEPVPSEATSLRVVTVAAGEHLVGHEGTEFILRSGKATAIGSAAGGIPDLTAGKDLANNVAIPANHLLLFPRSDQRGIKAVTSIIVMVRGSFTIEP